MKCVCRIMAPPLCHPFKCRCWVQVQHILHSALNRTQRWEGGRFPALAVLARMVKKDFLSGDGEHRPFQHRQRPPEL